VLRAIRLNISRRWDTRPRQQSLQLWRAIGRVSDIDLPSKAKASLMYADLVTDCALDHADIDLGAGLPLQLNVPERFAQVVNGVYRSGYPDVLHLDVWKAIGIKTIL
jgi:hypothetical protein